MILLVRKHIDTIKPVKAWKIITQYEDGTWLTGYFRDAPLFAGSWMKKVYNFGPGFHAFKSRHGATNALHVLVRGGFVHNPAYVVPCYLRGSVEFGAYSYGNTNLNIKGIRGSELLVKDKHIPRGIYD